jgi:hypothetical protein
VKAPKESKKKKKKKKMGPAPLWTVSIRGLKCARERSKEIVSSNKDYGRKPTSIYLPAVCHC